MSFDKSIPISSESAEETEKRNFKDAVRDWPKKVCSRDFAYKRVPILTWIRSYDLSCFVSDLVAGTTCGLTIIPQAIAYAAVAGLPLQYGLYASFVAPFVYIFLGSCKEISDGPTAIMALMTYSYARSGGAEYAVLLGFLAGSVELVAGILNLGFLVDFISAPVISGFVSAAALTVGSTQMKSLLGLKSVQGSSFIEIWTGVINNFHKVRPADAGLGCSCIVLLLLMRKLSILADLSCCSRCIGSNKAWLKKILWFVATSRNAFAVIGGCIATYFLKQNGYELFTITGDIKSGLPPFELPHFSINKTTGNVTEVVGFGDICLEIGTAIGLIPLIAILEQIAIVKAFAGGKKTDANQEMIALGVGNIIGSFFGSMPITASFGRSSVQSSSGVRTPMANLYVGVLVLLALGFLMPSLAYIPKPILAAVIISSVVFMIEYHDIKPMWRGRRVELIPLAVTFLSCLFLNMEYGILIGTGVHILLLTYTSNKPKPKFALLPDKDVSEERIIVKADSSLYYPGVENFRKTMNKVVLSSGSDTSDASVKSIIVDLEQMPKIDYTALKMLQSITNELHKRGMVLQFLNASKNVEKAISSTLPTEDIAFLPNVPKLT